MSTSARKYRSLYLNLGLLFAATSGYAASDSEFLNQSAVTGKLNAYYFTRNNDNNLSASQSTFSLGGQINVITGPILPGLKAGTSVYFAHSLGLNSKERSHVDNSLPDAKLDLGQLYLQYQTEYFLLRVGNQLIDTPWLSSADSRIFPRLYQGVYSELMPAKDLKLIGFRIIRFKDRIDSQFTKTNLYNTDSAGRSGIAGYDRTQNPGALALGAQYKLADVTAQAWYYRFYELANLFYSEINFASSQATHIKPIAGAQFLREWGDGKNLLRPYAGGAANTTGYGILLGAAIDNTQFTLSYNAIPYHKNAFQQGNILAPYSGDPLYTSSMIAGLTDAPGHAVKATGSYSFDKQMQLSASYAKYFTAPASPNTSETDLDLSYALSGKLKGLTMRYQVGVVTGNKTTGNTLYNRVILQYSF